MTAFQCAFPHCFTTNVTATAIAASFIPSSPLHFFTVSAIPPCLCDTFPKFGDLFSHRGPYEVTIPLGWASEGDRAPQFRQRILLFLRCHLTVPHGSGQPRVMVVKCDTCKISSAHAHLACMKSTVGDIGNRHSMQVTHSYKERIFRLFPPQLKANLWMIWHHKLNCRWVQNIVNFKEW